MTEEQDHKPAAFLRSPGGLVLIAFVAIAIFLLWQEHRAHLLGFLPYLLLLACPLLHLFMHRGHGGNGSHHRKERDQ